MAASWPPRGLSRREQEILGIVYRRRQASAAEVMAELRDAPVYGAVRTMLRRLEAKGHLRHRQIGARYVYEPTVPRPRAQQAALDWLARTFFDGSVVKAAAAAMDHAATDLSDEELDNLRRLVDRARRGRR